MADRAKSEFYTEDELAAFELLQARALELNKRSALPGAPTSSLSEVIERFDVRAFIDLSHLFGMRNRFSKMPKSEAAAAIAADLSDPESLSGLLAELPTADRKVFEEAIAGHLSDDVPVSNDIAVALQLMGLVAMFNVDDHVRYVVPDQIRRAYSQVATASFTALMKRNDTVSDMIVAAVNLYGTIGFYDMLGLAEHYLDTSLGEGDFYELVEKGIDYGEGFYLTKNDFITSTSLSDWPEEDIRALAQEAGTHPRYRPAKDIFLRYVYWEYFDPTPEADSLEMLFNVYFPRKPQLGAEAVLSVQDLAQQGADMDEITDALEDEFEVFLRDDPSRFDPVVKGIIEVANTTRMWLLNGHTPRELAGSGMEGAPLN